MGRNKTPKGPEASSVAVSPPVADELALAEAQGVPSHGVVEIDKSSTDAAVADEDEQQRPALPYPVVAFGASAGGLQAVRAVMENLPEKTGMAYVLVTHLAPDQKSFLTEIMSRFTKMPVKHIEEGQQPLQDHFYVLSPGLTVQLQGGVFRLELRTSSDRFPMSIDTFFRSLASDQKNHAIGVVLSGADSDGALGLKAIKGEGGIAIVQQPDTATHSDMPRNSIAADHVDLVVPPGEIGAELARLAKQFAKPEVRSLEEGVPIPTNEQSFSRILQMLRNAFGMELRHYKPDTIRRRIARRMILLRMESLPEYANYLQLRRDELHVLKEDVLINVTRFFRDPAFWEALRTDILPLFFESRPAEHAVRIWCAGCSSGEEAYSLAITFLEFLSANGLDTPIQIFGTDASDRSIDMARIAMYPESLASEIAPERLRRFFVKVDRGYQVSKRVRDCCIFAKQNLCADPPFSHIDFLSCRNVLIYFDQALQRQIMGTFHYALEPRGYLILGMSESLRDSDDSFAAVDRKNKIYMKVGTTPAAHYRLPLQSAIVKSGERIVRVNPLGDWPEMELQRAADGIVLARFGPPGLIVDERLNVLQVRGQVSPYVELAAGAVSWSLLRVLREGMAREVREALKRVIRENIPVTAVVDYKRPGEEGEERIQVDVIPVTSPTSQSRCFMILFTALEADRPPGALEGALLPVLSADEKDKHIVQLRQDLASLRFHLQSLIEERDARNQELVSANEEIQSGNEELQSTNEELETTKEELQSSNEELQTVNEELQQRNAVLTQTGNDLNNLLTSTSIPLMMLTDQLHIRQFTPPMERLLNIRASDVGRPISEIRLQLSVENIEPILQDVLDTLGTREMEVQDRDGRWHLLRVRPYRTAENKIEGVVVVLVEIDELRRSQQQMREAHDFASSVLESVPIPLVVMESDCRIRTVNTAFRDLTGMQSNLAGQSLPDLVRQLWGVDHFRERLESLAASATDLTLEFEYDSSKTGLVLLVRGRSLSRDGSRVVLLTLEDITQRQQAAALIAHQNIELEREIERTGRTLTEAQEELRGLTAYLLAAQEEERRHIARELHDDIAQRLSALRMEFDAARNQKDERARNDALEAIHGQIDSLNTEVRNLSHRLHPAILDDLGLPTALKALVDDFQEREQMVASYIGSDLPETIPRDAATALYRITQETLRNVAKHAGRTHVKVVLQGQDHLLRLEVRDFGTGFDQEDGVPRQGLGMISMKERARIAGGKLSVRSGLGEGTTVSAEVPIDG